MAQGLLAVGGSPRLAKEAGGGARRAAEEGNRRTRRRLGGLKGVAWAGQQRAGAGSGGTTAGRPYHGGQGGCTAARGPVAFPPFEAPRGAGGLGNTRGGLGNTRCMAWMPRAGGGAAARPGAACRARESTPKVQTGPV
jgi:hypothetical protein